MNQGVFCFCRPIESNRIEPNQTETDDCLPMDRILRGIFGDESQEEDDEVEQEAEGVAMGMMISIPIGDDPCFIDFGTDDVS
mmetsp:Transcript_38721/g.93768  ORF Transcript_38721/g.93768 Transcript_38721/m.93768 type:complete len:82 (+) Transcript_38721:100-345(+)